MLQIALCIVAIILIIYCVNYCNTPRVVIIDSDLPGPTIGIVGSVHGNEPAGWATLESIIKNNYKPPRGKLILVFANRGGHILNIRRNPGSLRDTNRQFMEAGGVINDQLARNIVSALNGSDVIIDLHEGFNFHLLPPDWRGQSIGSTISPSDNKMWVELAPKIIDELNKNIVSDYKKFVILWNRYCEIKNTLNCYAHQKNIPYILIETSGQNDIQPLDLRVAQMRTIISTIVDYMNR